MKQVASQLSREILKKTSSALEQHLHLFFNNYLVLGKTGGSTLIPSMYDIIYELSHILPQAMAGVLPQLEMKLKCKENNERLEVNHSEIIDWMKFTHLIPNCSIDS